MFDNEKVDKLKYLPDVDKKYLNSIKNHIPWTIICSNMSIFSKKICLDEFDQYKYLETRENADIFLIKSYHVFVDSDKKIIMYLIFLFVKLYIYKTLRKSSSLCFFYFKHFTC